MLKHILATPVFLLSFLIPKNKNLWLFGSWSGKRYADNSKYLFEYILKNKPDIKAVWLTQDKLLYKKLLSNGIPCVYRNSIKAIYYCLRASFAVITQKKSADIHITLNYYCTKIIQLWHGIPLKKIHDDDNRKLPRKKRLRIKFLPTMNTKFSMMIACSDEDRSHFSTAFKIDLKSVKITGYPRNDLLIENILNTTKKIIYMPTFRKKVGSQVEFFKRYGFNKTKTLNLLSIHNAELYFKLHPVNLPNKLFVDEINNSKRMQFLDENIDIYETLNHYDILITDFSSIYFDFLLLNKPIIFSTFDFNTYLSQDRELYYEYNSVTPGPKCNNWEEVLEEIDLLLTKDSDPYYFQRNSLKTKFHNFTDGNASKRVYSEIIKLL